MTEATALKEPSDGTSWYLEHVLPWPGYGESGCIVISWTKGPRHWMEQRVHTSSEALSLIRKLATDQTIIGIFASQGRMQTDVAEKRSARLRAGFQGYLARPRRQRFRSSQ